MIQAAGHIGSGPSGDVGGRRQIWGQLHPFWVASEKLLIGPTQSPHPESKNNNSTHLEGPREN